MSIMWPFDKKIKHYSGITTCKCGCGKKSSTELEKLNEKIADDVYTACGIITRITSGARCALHNRQVGGASGSIHTYGMALDYEVLNDQHLYHIVGAAYRHGIKRIGLYKNKSIVHVDMGGPLQSATECVIWIS